MKGRRRSSVRVPLGLTALLAAALTGCAPAPPYAEVTYDDSAPEPYVGGYDDQPVEEPVGDPEYVGFCVDETTSVRVADQECDDGDDEFVAGPYAWYLLPYGRRVPAVGAHVKGALHGSHLHDGAVVVTGVPPKGGTRGTATATSGGGGVTRGGFGGASSSS